MVTKVLSSHQIFLHRVHFLELEKAQCIVIFDIVIVLRKEIDQKRLYKSFSFDVKCHTVGMEYVICLQHQQDH